MVPQPHTQSARPVHARRERNGRVLRCRPRRAPRPRPHGAPLACGQRHGRDDPLLGEPMCPSCYDYTGTVLFNACAPELWRRFTITLRRALARQAGLTAKTLAAQMRVSFTKVAEYQRRASSTSTPSSASTDRPDRHRTAHPGTLG